MSLGTRAFHDWKDCMIEGMDCRVLSNGYESLRMRLNTSFNMSL